MAQTKSPVEIPAQWTADRPPSKYEVEWREALEAARTVLPDDLYGRLADAANLRAIGAYDFGVAWGIGSLPEVESDAPRELIIDAARAALARITALLDGLGVQVPFSTETTESPSPAGAEWKAAPRSDEVNDADRRYSEKLEAIRAVDVNTRKLGWELDMIVGERLAAGRDEVIAECLGGVLIDGTIELPGATVDAWGVRVKVPTVRRRSLNPSFDGCRCDWGRAVWEDQLSRETDHGGNHARVNIANGERLHEILLALDGPNPLEAVDELLVHLADQCTPYDLEFESIVAQHNWSDPVTMRNFASTIDTIWRIMLNAGPGPRS